MVALGVEWADNAVGHDAITNRGVPPFAYWAWARAERRGVGRSHNLHDTQVTQLDLQPGLSHARPQRDDIMGEKRVRVDVADRLQ